MAVPLGVDLGTGCCVLAAIVNRTVTVLRNEVSDRLTPSVVAYTEKERLIGDAALAQIKSNLNSTCRYMKQILGRLSSDLNKSSFVEIEQFHCLADLVPVENSNQIGFSVMYQKEPRIFTVVQVLGALIRHLLATAEKALGKAADTVVFSVPSWYSDAARRAVLDAAHIAGITAVHVLSETAAISLDYGIFRFNTFKADRPSRVMFVSMGHGSSNVSVCAFLPSGCTVLSSVSSRLISGRMMDRFLMTYVATEFEKTSKVNILANKKSKFKLEEAVVKAKKVLSANTDCTVQVEYVYEEHDLSVPVSRDTFESICTGMRDWLSQLLQLAVNRSGEVYDIDSVELAGGCTRIPWVQQTILQFFRDRGHNKLQTLSRTLSQDECVARGCALRAASFSSRVRVMQFNVAERVFKPVRIRTSSPFHFIGQKDTQLEASVDGVGYGLMHTLVFVPPLPTSLDVTCTIENEADTLEYELNRSDGRLTTYQWNVEVTEDRVQKELNVELLMDVDGIPVMNQAYVIEVEEQVKKRKQKKSAPPKSNDLNMSPPQDPLGASTDESTEGADAQQPSTGEGSSQNGLQASDSTGATSESQTPAAGFEEVTYTEKVEVARQMSFSPVRRPSGFLSDNKRSDLRREEQKMTLIDLSLQEARDLLNEFESHIYDFRNKVGANDQLCQLINEEEREALNRALESAEEALYADKDLEDADAEKSYYGEHLQLLKAVTDPLVERQAALNNVFQELTELQQQTIPAILEKSDWIDISLRQNLSDTVNEKCSEASALRSAFATFGSQVQDRLATLSRSVQHLKSEAYSMLKKPQTPESQAKKNVQTRSSDTASQVDSTVDGASVDAQAKTEPKAAV